MSVDWAMSAVVMSIISFGYAIWVEMKVKKLNDKIAKLEKGETVSAKADNV